jgi:serine/threonine-protein kinase RsbW
MRVGAAGISEVRRRVADVARRAGLGQDRLDRFIVAVNEIAINAVQHGGGTAEVTIAADGSRVTVTVTDDGGGIDRDVSVTLPPPDRLNGRGLWLAHQLCDDVSIDSSAAGTRVRLIADAGTR